MILGVNPNHDCSYCAVDESGRICFLLEEERFNRIKHTDFVSCSCLDAEPARSLLSPDTVETIAYSFEIEPEIVASLQQRCFDNVRRDFGADGLLDTSKTAPENVLSPLQRIGRSTDCEDLDGRLRTRFPRAQVVGYNHHLAHAASAFFPSPFREAAVLVVDGAGLLETSTIWHGLGDELRRLHQTELPHSIGLFYYVVSYALGLEEGKVMGLAPYGRPLFASTLRERAFGPDAANLYRLRAPIISWGDEESTERASDALLRLVPVRKRRFHSDAILQEHADLAASVQLIAEEALLALVGYARRLLDCEAIVFSGGVMQNCVAMGRALRSHLFAHHWIQPVPHDAGAAWLHGPRSTDPLRP